MLALAVLRRHGRRRVAGMNPDDPDYFDRDFLFVAGMPRAATRIWPA
jgi:hypothetical protein